MMPTTEDDSSVTVPSQAALDSIVRRLGDLLDEAKALTRCAQNRGSANLCLTSIPAALFHALPQRVVYPSNPTRRKWAWKEVAGAGPTTITVWCDHDTACPDMAREESAS